MRVAENKTISKTISYSGLLILAMLFVVVNMVSSNLFKSARIDLTQNRLYTLSAGTINILASIQEPITLYYFFSDQASRNIPQLRTYATRVQELLQEYTQLSNGKITLNIIDPVAYSEQEDQAGAFGLQAVPAAGSSGEAIYFGLAGANAVGESELIAFFQPGKEQFLEYDVTKLIYTLANSKKPVVGLMSQVPMFSSFDAQTQRIRDPWVITSRLQQLFEVRNIDSGATELDEDLELLMLVHPKALSQQTLYAIDQYVLKGGNLIVYVDPYAEADAAPANPGLPVQPQARSSDLKLLFDAWGIEYSPAQVAGDRKYALTVDAGDGRQQRHYAILGLDQAALEADNVMTSGLTLVTVAMAGSVRPKDAAGIRFEPLIHSSNEAALLDASRFGFLPDVSSLAQNFNPGGEEYAIAGRFELTPGSAFPDGPPASDPGAGSEENTPASAAAHISEGAQKVNIIVVADVDMLADRMWVNVQNFLGQNIYDAWASNGDFAINAVDNMLGSSDLIGIRGRATASRPFTRVPELRRQAADQFRRQEQVLQNKLRATEQKISQLQSQRDDQSTLILSPEQSAEIERFQQEKLQVRKELRKVRHQLDKNIKQLGAWLKAVNIGLMPVILTVLALILSALRIKKRLRHYA